MWLAQRGLQPSWRWPWRDPRVAGLEAWDWEWWRTAGGPKGPQGGCPVLPFPSGCPPIQLDGATWGPILLLLAEAALAAPTRGCGDGDLPAARSRARASGPLPQVLPAKKGGIWPGLVALGRAMPCQLAPLPALLRARPPALQQRGRPTLRGGSRLSTYLLFVYWLLLVKINK